MSEENQPQVEEAKVVEPVGEEIPQPAEQPEPEQLGAEEKPQEKVEEKPPEPPRTYSQDEWSKRESEKDKEISHARDQLAQLNLQAEITKSQQSEREATARDQKEIDDGSLTTVEAEKRRDVRTQQRQTDESIAKQQQTLRQMSQQTEQYGRVLAAQDFGKKYGLTSDQITEILSDKDVKTPGDMRAKAADLALERERGETKKAKEPSQKFDQGQSSNSGGELPTTAKGLIKAGWEDISKKRK